MVKLKGYKIVIWVMMLVLLASSGFLIVFAFGESNTKHNEDPMALEISNFDQFKSFISSAYKNDYSGQTIYLKGNIDCGGSDLSIGYEDSLGGSTADTNNCTFKGVFDGQGYTISNVSRNIGLYDGYNVGFFCRSSGTIKNTRFEDFTFNIGATDGSHNSYVGAIVGKNTGIIENCIVKDCKFISNRYRSNCYVAAVAGKNDGTIRNCLVEGGYWIGGKSWNLLSNPDGLYSYYFAVSGTYPINSIFLASVYKVTNDNNDGSYVSNPSETGDSLGSSNYLSCKNAYTGMASSVASKTGGEEGTPWFKYSVDSRGYNRSGSLCVYLRRFITWTTYTFTASPSSAGSLNYGMLTVPKDYDNVIETVDNELMIDLTYIRPTPAIGNDFDKWTNNGNAYTANFLARIQLSFAAAENATIDRLSTAKIGTTYYLANPTTITFTHEDYAKSGRFKTYTISFVDKNGSSYFIRYKANANYYISGNTISRSSNTTYSMTANKTNITVTTAFKSYNVELK